MQIILVSGASLAGIIKIPPSKSHTMRAILFGSMAAGESLISNYLPSSDTDAMIKACEKLGATVRTADSALQITGVAGCPSLPDEVIDAQNSGQILYFLGAVA